MSQDRSRQKRSKLTFYRVGKMGKLVGNRAEAAGGQPKASMHLLTGPSAGKKTMKGAVMKNVNQGGNRYVSSESV